jgi:hypothetical protein
MKIPEIVLQVKYKFEKLEAAERTGDEANVIAWLVDLRELLDSEPELKAGGACESPESS